MKKRSKVLVVLAILFCLSAYYIVLYLKSKNSKLFHKIVESYNNEAKETEEAEENDKDFQVKIANDDCSPFNLSAKQFQVTIDGVTYPKLVPLRDNATIDFKCINKVKKTKLILLWTPFYDRDTFYFGLGKFQPFKEHRCPAYNCEITKEKSRLKESDIVVVSFQNRIDPIPDTKSFPKQQWAFVLIESPVHLNGFSGYNNKFNLAATYRTDANFYSHYAFESHRAWEPDPSFDPNFDFYAGKTDFAAIVVSNCGGSSGRLQYVNQMKKYVPVKIFGACGDACPSKFDNGTAADCKVIISQKFKFFLSFENSLCKDYITEKFFIILKYNIIPVVLGAGEYDKYVPKSGYINALDYKTPKDLTNYLLYLDKNRTAYNSYFQWRRWARKKYDGVFAAEICELCIKAHIDAHTGFEKSYIKNFDQYWNGATDCKSQGSYPQLN